MVNYTTIKELGRGSFGVVHEAERGDGLRVAVKQFNDPKIRGVPRADLVKRFEREVRYQKRISHRNVVRVLDDDLTADPPWFVMELADCTLQDMMNNGGLDPAMRDRALFDILAGLEELHAHDFTHRDLKPANVLYFAREDRFAISDFGLGANRDGLSSTLTATGVTGGTEQYAAPELARSLKSARRPADIYSFGAILHDFFGGGARIPYRKHRAPGEVGNVIEKCTEEVPIRRFQNIQDLRAALYNALQTNSASPHSATDQKILELLQNDSLSVDDLDHIFLTIDQRTDEKSFNQAILIAFPNGLIHSLGRDHPELLVLLLEHYFTFVRETEGRLDFNFCDILLDKMAHVYDAADDEGRAKLLLAMLTLGTSHNRFYVEKRFASLAGINADSRLVARMLIEAEVENVDVGHHLRHVMRSIGTSPSDFHPLLQEKIP